MSRRILCLIGMMPLLSSCPVDRYVSPDVYTVTQSDRIAMQNGIRAFFDRKAGVEITAARAFRMSDLQPVRITVCGSFTVHDINQQPAKSQEHLFGGILTDTKDGRRIFDVSSLEKAGEQDGGAPISVERSGSHLHRVICP